MRACVVSCMRVAPPCAVAELDLVRMLLECVSSAASVEGHVAACVCGCHLLYIPLTPSPLQPPIPHPEPILFAFVCHT